MHAIQDLIQDLFRKMPYEYLSGLHISGEELFAAIPNWVVLEPEQDQAEAGVLVGE
jgi:hypothetical protein